MCAVVGLVVFHFFGNAGRGYIDTASLFVWWGYQWFNAGSESEHGPFIVAAALWLGWRNLRSQPVSPPTGVSRGAWVALGVGLGLHALGYTVEQARLSIVGLLLFAWGTVALGGGVRWGRAFRFPLAFLVFAIPVNALDSVGFHLRVWVIDATEAIARAAGVEVIRNGTQLFAPDGSYQYDVAAACSGVRSLVALMALSLLIAYLNVRSAWRRMAVFLLVFPLTYLGNVIRIGAIIAAGELFGQEAGLWVHAWAGFVVFLVVLGGVLAAVAFMGEKEPGLPAVAAAESSGSPSGRRPVLWPGVAGVAVVAAAVIAWTVAMDRRPVTGGAGIRLGPDGQSPIELPMSIGVEWIGRRTEVTAIEREVLPPDTGFSRRLYVSTADRQDQVFVSLVLSGRDRTSIHRPELCLVGQGWTITGRTRHVFLHPNGGDVPATLLRVQREHVDGRGERRVVPALFAYWFVGDGVMEATHGGRLWRTAVNRLRGRTDRWAYIVAQTLVDERGEEAARNRLQTVLDGTLPAFLPEAAPEHRLE